MFLPDHIIVERRHNILGRGHAVLGLRQSRLAFLADNIHAQFDAFVANEHGRTRDQLAHLMLALAAEGAIKRVLGIGGGRFCHRVRLSVRLLIRESRRKRVAGWLI